MQAEQKYKVRLINFYFIYNLIIIFLWLLLAFGPVWHRNALDVTQQSIPPQWNEYIKNYLDYLLPPAIYGLFSLQVIRNIKRGRKPEIVYFLGALGIGIIMTLMAGVNSGLARVDCNNACMPDVPSYFAFYTTSLLAIPPLLLIPGYILYKLKIYHKKSHLKNKKRLSILFASTYCAQTM